MRPFRRAALLAAAVATVCLTASSAQAVVDPPSTIGCNPVCEGTISTPPPTPSGDTANLADFTEAKVQEPWESPELTQLDVTDTDPAIDAASETPDESDDATFDSQVELKATTLASIDATAKQYQLGTYTKTATATGMSSTSSMTEAAATCGCGSNNKSQIKGAMKLMGIKYFRYKNFVARLGKTYGPRVYNAFVIFSSNQVAKMKKDTPYPDRRAKSANNEPTKSDPYQVYEIYYRHLGPVYAPDTYKFGITRQYIARQRPQRQIPACIRWAKSKGYLDCDWQWIYQNVPGWFLARVMESTLITLYGVTHNGDWPPGNPYGL